MLAACFKSEWMRAECATSVYSAMLAAAPAPDPAAVPADAWQPIETAPKDGTWFLVIDPNSPMAWAPYGFCCWNTEVWGRPEGFWCEEDVSEEIHPTHWMPLPAAPAPATGGEHE